MPQRATERRTMDEAAAWPVEELRAIAERLQESRERLSGLADELLFVEAGPAGFEATGAVLGIQRRAWGVAADLIGSVGRLAVLALGLRRPAAMDDTDAPAADAAELLR